MALFKYVILLFQLNLLLSQLLNEFELLVINDLSYAGSQSNNSKQRLNLVLPKTLDKPPLIVWIGGGAWSYVDKDKEMDLAIKLAIEGFAVASVGHRLSPAIWKDPSLKLGVKHPQHAIDISLALRWLIENKKFYNYDEQHVFLAGFSSGAHLATLVGFDNSYLDKVGVPLQVIKGVIAISGTYDIENYYTVIRNSRGRYLAENHVEAVFGSSKQKMREASPIHFVRKNSLATFLISDVDSYAYSMRLEDKLKTVGNVLYQSMHTNYGHSGLWKHLSNDKNSSIRKKIIKFIRKQITPSEL